MTAEHRQPRFLAGGDDVERDARLGVNPLDEGAAVARAAAGFGRDRAGKGDASPLHLVRADP